MFVLLATSSSAPLSLILLTPLSLPTASTPPTAATAFAAASLLLVHSAFATTALLIAAALLAPLFVTLPSLFAHLLFATRLAGGGLLNGAELAFRTATILILLGPAVFTATLVSFAATATPAAAALVLPTSLLVLPASLLALTPAGTPARFASTAAPFGRSASAVALFVAAPSFALPASGFLTSPSPLRFVLPSLLSVLLVPSAATSFSPTSRTVVLFVMIVVCH